MELMQPVERAERILKEMAEHPRGSLGSVQWGLLTKGIEQDRQALVDLILSRCATARHEGCDCRAFGELLLGRVVANHGK